jgi:hypothetical protein
MQVVAGGCIDMKKTENDIMKLFTEMLKVGLISTGNSWIDIAIKQKNAKLPLAIASSKILTYDQLDKKVLTLGHYNQG